MIFPGLPTSEETTKLVDRFTSIESHVASLDKAWSKLSAVTTNQVIKKQLSSDGPTTMVPDARELLILRAVFSTNGSTRYTLRIGQDRSFRWTTGSTQPPVELVGRGAVHVVPRGLEVAVEFAAGNPAWDLTLWCVAADVPGTVGVRQ